MPKALFVSVIQEPQVLSSRQAITELIDFAKKSQNKVLFVQIYRENKAWFPSKVGDSEPYDTCFKAVSEDPLELLIKKAHAEGIQVHAWLNLMSLSANENAPLLKKYGTEILTRNIQEKHTLQDYKIDDQYFLEPGDLRVREELATMVGEVVSRYPKLDGVQFDYIRYPDMHPYYGHTPMNEKRFKEAAGVKVILEESRVWKQWKRDQVTDLLKELAQKARAIHPGIQVSTTGLVSYDRAYFEGFQDWRSWLRHGPVDFVTLMCYTKDIEQFKRQIQDAERRTDGLKRVNIAVGAYSLLETPDIFKKEFKLCEGSGARSCVTFHYGSLVENPELAR